MRNFLPLLLCLCVIGKVIPPILDLPSKIPLTVDDDVDVENQRPNEQFSKRAVSDLFKAPQNAQVPGFRKTGDASASSKIYPSYSKNAIPYLYMVQFFQGVKKDDVDKIVAYIDGLQRKAASTEQNPAVRAYLSRKTSKQYGGVTTLALNSKVPYFTGYFLPQVVSFLANNIYVVGIFQDSRDVVLAGYKAYNPVSISNTPWYLSDLSALAAGKPQQSRDVYRSYEADGDGTVIYMLDDISAVSGIHDVYTHSIRVLRPYLHFPLTGTPHGMVSAGFAASRNRGVAANAQVVMVETGLCISDVVIAINAAVQDYTLNQRAKSPQGAVINLGIAISGKQNLDLITLLINAVRKSSQFISFVMPAGNTGRDSSEDLFTQTSSAIVVGAVNSALEITKSSCHGRYVDTYAPGENLKAYTGTVSGTSYSAALVAGLAAYYYSLLPNAASEYFSQCTMSSVDELISDYALQEIRFGTRERLSYSNNKLANNGFAAGYPSSYKGPSHCVHKVFKQTKRP